MSSTKNTKDNRQVVRAVYSTESIFEIPDGLDLEDKSVVKDWGVKWNLLYITYVNGEVVSFEPKEDATQCDMKHPDETEIIPAEDIMYEYEEVKEEILKTIKEQRCKKHDLYMYEDNKTKCSKCCEELGEEYSGKYSGDTYGCGYTGLSEQCNLCVKCNPKLWWLERRPTKLPRMVKEFENN